MSSGSARRKGWRTAAIFASAGWLTSAAPPAAADNPNALWRFVHEQCVPHQAQFGTPLPCASVDEARGYAILKDLRGASQFLLIGTARVPGIEDPAILASDAPNYWLPAWDATRLVQALLGRALPREALSLAINSASRRPQNQIHIHADCVSVELQDHGCAVANSP